jgi:hypothetical protein
VINAIFSCNTVLARGLKILPEGGYFKRNEKVTLSCISTTDQSNPALVSWYKNDAIIFPDNHDVIIDNNGSLAIAKFQPDDEGYYQCETRRGEFRQSPVVAVILFGKIPEGFY